MLMVNIKQIYETNCIFQWTNSGKLWHMHMEISWIKFWIFFFKLSEPEKNNIKMTKLLFQKLFLLCWYAVEFLDVFIKYFGIIELLDLSQRQKTIKWQCPQFSFWIKIYLDAFNINIMFPKIGLWYNKAAIISNSSNNSLI